MRIAKGTLTADTLLDFSIILLIILTCFPMTMCLPSIIRYALQVIAMITFFLGLLVTRDRKKFFLFIIIVSVMLVRVFAIWHYRKSLVSCAFSVYVAWAFAFYGFHAYKQGNEKRCKRILLFLLFVFTITAITTIIGVQRYPLAVRELGRSTSYSGLSDSDFAMQKWKYRIRNIAGWNQLYGMVFVIPCFVYAYVYSRKKVFLLGAILCELCVVRAQLTFALLLSVLLIIACIYKPSMKRKDLMVEVILLFVGIMAICNISLIVLLMVKIASVLGMSTVERKLNDLYFLFQGTSTGDVLGRVTHYKQSIDVFISHPIFGQSLWGVFSPEMFSYHSDFFDMLGYYGLFGVFLSVVGSILYLKFMRKISRHIWFSYILFLGFWALYVFNPIWYSPQVFIGVFMIPGLFSKAFSVYKSSMVIERR